MMTLDFVQAKLKHASWKSKMRHFLNGESSLTESQAVSHRDCDLGKWLYSDGKANFNSIPEFRELEMIHEKLHSYVRNIIRKKESGDSEGAEMQFQSLNTASNRIIELLDVLDRKISAM